MQVWNQIKIEGTLETPLPIKCPIPLPLPWKHSLNICPLKCQESLGHVTPRMAGWVSVSHAMVALVESNYAAGKAVWAEGPVSLYCRENEVKVTTRKWGPDFPNIHCWTFLELQVTPNPSCWSWQNFIVFTRHRYPPGVCWGNSSSHVLPIPTVWGGLGGSGPHMPLWLLLLFLLSGRILACSLLFRSQGRVAGHAKETSSLFANSAIHAMLMSIWPRRESWAQWVVCSSGSSPTWLLRQPSPSVPYWPGSSTGLLPMQILC